MKKFIAALMLSFVLLSGVVIVGFEPNTAYADCGGGE